MKYLFTCQWCGKHSISYYNTETICQVCDSELIDLTHSIFQTQESEELMLNGYTLEQISEIIKGDMSYISALKSLRKESDHLVESFLGGV